MKTDLARGQDPGRRRWLGVDPRVYDRATDRASVYLAAIDAPLLAVCSGRVLELACGSGRLLDRLRALPAVVEAVGLDIAPQMLVAAAERGHERLVQAAAETLPFLPEEFDTVVCAFYTLRDLDRRHVYAEVTRVLRPGGVFAFTLRSYYTAYLETLWRKFLRHGRRPRSWRTLDGADGIERDLRDLNGEIRAVEAAGLRVREVKSLRFLPFLRRWIMPGYWSGPRTARLGSDVIIVAGKR
jgi:SAM-dependent methyltransferase